MGTPKKKKGGGGKLSRSETVTVRLDPKLRYLAGLAARKQRRTLSSFIEWALEDILNRVIIFEDHQGAQVSIADEALSLWDVDEADRFVKLALNHPDLLTHDEQILWKLIQENGNLWRGHYDSDGEWRWHVIQKSIIYDRLREYWDIFNAVAEGNKEKDCLPKCEKKPPEDDDDNLPF